MDANKLIEVMGQETDYSRSLRTLDDKQRKFEALSKKFFENENLPKAKYYWTLSLKAFDKKMELMEQRFTE